LAFVCGFCGEHHDEQMLDIRMQFPDPVFGLSDEERQERVDHADDATILDPDTPVARFFVRGLLELPIAGTEELFAYGAWVEMEKDAFRRIGHLWWDPRGREEPPFPGRLANELAPYRATSGLSCELKLQDVDRVPAIRLVASEHPLSVDQRSGITFERVHDLAATAF
jgi:hypothetical protein